MLGLLGQRREGKGRVRRAKARGTIMGGLTLFGTSALYNSGALCLCDRISRGRSALSTPLGILPGGVVQREQHKNNTEAYTDRHVL